MLLVLFLLVIRFFYILDAMLVRGLQSILLLVCPVSYLLLEMFVLVTVLMPPLSPGSPPRLLQVLVLLWTLVLLLPRLFRGMVWV